MIRIVGMRAPNPEDTEVAVNCCSNSFGWQRDLSPFLIGPCHLYSTNTEDLSSENMENAWQYSKLYAVHADQEGNPTDEYWYWAKRGWANPKAVRYPMGKGKKPLCSLWKGEKLSYVAARKKIYIPLYAQAVQRTAGFERLQELYKEGLNIVLRDFDGYDHDSLGLSLFQVLNNPNRKMGHAFVLKMLLTNDPALEEVELRPQDNHDIIPSQA